MDIIRIVLIAGLIFVTGMLAKEFVEFKDEKSKQNLLSQDYQQSPVVNDSNNII